MSTRTWRHIAGVAGITCATTASALSTDGFHSIEVVPVVVSTGSFSAEIYVFNPNPFATNINFTYYPAAGTAQATTLNCGNKSIPANGSSAYFLTTLCPGLAAGSNFGMLEANELDAQNRPFNVFVRVNNPQGQGFSIEGFPPHTFTGDQYWVNGLRRQTAAPGYTTNCFFGALGEATTLQYELYNASGTQIGNIKSVVLAARQLVRVVDIFADVGLGGEYTNVRLRTLEFGTGEPGAVVFCTVQNNTTFDADFRIGKGFPMQDDHAFRTHEQSASAGEGGAPGVPFSTGSVPNSRTRHVVYFKHPDRVQCSVTGGAGLEMRLVAPDGITQVAGGSGQTGFNEVYLGAKSTRNFGSNGQWFIDVEQTAGGPSTYTLTCSSGSGHTPYEVIGRNLPDAL